MSVIGRLPRTSKGDSFRGRQTPTLASEQGGTVPGGRAKLGADILNTTMSRAATRDFGSTIADFTRFAVEHGYPPQLLWTSSEFVLFWRRRLFVLAVDPEVQHNQAKASFDVATARNVGVAIEGKCKTQTATIARVYEPIDATDAQDRMIPATGVKMTVVVDPPPVVLVRNRAWWRILKFLSKGSATWWD